jgi:hypothetical protein
MTMTHCIEMKKMKKMKKMMTITLILTETHATIVMTRRTTHPLSVKKKMKMSRSALTMRTTRSVWMQLCVG